MIIIKYNFLASYTKLLHNYFDCIFKNKNINYNLNFSYKNFEKFKLENFKNNNFLEICENYNEDNLKIFFLECIDDIGLINPEPFKNILNYIKKPIIFFIIPDYKKRLESLIYRDNINIFKNISIDNILQQNFQLHLDFFKIKDIDINYCTFQKTILFSDFEDLIELYNQNKLDIIAITETGINKPEIYFDIAGINVKNINFKNIENYRMKKEITIKKVKFLNDFLKLNKHIIEDRYREIFRLLKENNIEVVS